MRNIVVLTGAGVSAESGISTFRDSGGLWDNYRIEDVATPTAWKRNPELVLEFYNSRRKQLLSCSPNDAHLGLAKLQNSCNLQIITQNVDNLHEQAGSKNVLHLHGELMKVRSERYPELIYELSADRIEIKRGDTCEKGEQLRPHIVWFGEAVPEIENAQRLVSKADVFVVIGTSLTVYPAAALIDYTPKDIPIYIIDPNEVYWGTKYNITHIKKVASQGVAELLTLL